MTTIMVATITIYVNTIVIMAMAMTMTETTTRITKTRIMAVVAPTTMTKISKQVQQDNFYCLVKMIKKATKNQFALLL